MSMEYDKEIKLGNYFIVTSGYCASGGLVNKTKEALLFLSDENNLFRVASYDEIKQYQDHHPILKGS